MRIRRLIEMEVKDLTRSDAWTEEDDETLIESIMHHVRTGSTQQKAFEETGIKINRTSAACGFRWNSYLRHKQQNSESLKHARSERRKAVIPKADGNICPCCKQSIERW